MKKCLLFNIVEFCIGSLIIYDVLNILNLHENAINKLSEFHYKDLKRRNK